MTAAIHIWRKSSHSKSGNCAEITAWRKSSRSAFNGGCAEVGQDGAVVGVRDSQDPDGPVLAFPAAAWRTFTARVKRNI